MRLFVRFPSPGLFVNDPRLVVNLSGEALYEGSFCAGFERSLDLAPGRYLLSTSIDGPMLARSQSFLLALEAEGGYRDVPIVEATLRYSRWTGGFARRLTLRALR